MKRISLAVLMLAATGIPTAFGQEAPDVNVFSFADTSCTEWSNSAYNELSRTVYTAWFRGFISGYNFGNSANQVVPTKMPDPVSLSLYIDKYCKNNPKLPFIGAAIPLVQDIREFRVAVPPPKQ